MSKKNAKFKESNEHILCKHLNFKNTMLPFGSQFLIYMLHGACLYGSSNFSGSGLKKKERKKKNTLAETEVFFLNKVCVCCEQTATLEDVSENISKGNKQI